MNDTERVDPGNIRAHLVQGSGLRRIEHYALYLLNGMAAAGSGGLTDEDIDMAIDTAERLAGRLAERGHIMPHE